MICAVLSQLNMKREIGPPPKESVDKRERKTRRIRVKTKYFHRKTVQAKTGIEPWKTATVGEHSNPTLPPQPFDITPLLSCRRRSWTGNRVPAA